MSQYDFGVIDPDVTDGVTLADYLNQWKTAVVSNHCEPGNPPYALPGMLFTRQTSDTFRVEVYDGTAFIPLIAGNEATGQVTVGGPGFSLAFSSTGNYAFDRPVRITASGSPAAPGLVIGGNTDAGFYESGSTICYSYNGNIAARFDGPGTSASAAQSIITREKGDARYVARSGSSMTGYLTLNANPSSSSHAATKSYVDSTVSSAVASGTSGFLRDSGDTMNGVLYMGNHIRLNSGSYIQGYSGGWKTLLYTDSASNTDNLGASNTKTRLRGQSVQIDGPVTSEGTLTVKGAANVQNRLTVEAAGGGNPTGYMNSHSPSGNFQMGSGSNSDVAFHRNGDTKLLLAPAQAEFATDYTVVTYASGGSANAGAMIRGYKGGGETYRIRNDGNMQNSNNSYGALSDRRLKDNIAPLDAQTELKNILRLRPSEWDWKDGRGHSTGLISQDVEKVFPEFVYENDDGMKVVAYSRLTAHLISAIQALNQQVAALQDYIDEKRDL